MLYGVACAKQRVNPYLNGLDQYSRSRLVGCLNQEWNKVETNTQYIVDATILRETLARQAYCPDVRSDIYDGALAPSTTKRAWIRHPVME